MNTFELGYTGFCVGSVTATYQIFGADGCLIETIVDVTGDNILYETCEECIYYSVVLGGFDGYGAYCQKSLCGKKASVYVPDNPSNPDSGGCCPTDSSGNLILATCSGQLSCI